MRALIAFVGVAGLSVAVTLTFAAMDVSFWPVAILIVTVGMCLSRIGPLEKVAPALMVAYGSAFTALYMASLRASISPKAVAARQAASSTLLAIAGVALILTVLWADRRTRGSLKWVVPALILGVFVAWISGDRGSADPMRASLLQWMSPLMAEIVLTAFRKAVHLGFYGALAWLIYTGGARLGVRVPWAAFSFSMAQGLFDEYRQASVPSRYGTPWDLLFDAAGAYLALRWAGAFRPRTVCSLLADEETRPGR